MKPNETGGRYLLFCTTGLGDSLFCTPAIRFLRLRRPTAHLTVVAKSRILDLFNTNPRINKLLSYHTNPISLGLTRRRISRGGPYQAVFLFHVNSEAARLVRRISCEELHCVKMLPGLPAKANVFPINIAAKRQWEDFADMVAQAVGGKNDNHEFELPLTEESRKKADDFYLKLPAAGGPRLGLQLGGSHLGKCWPPERYAALATAILQRYGGCVFVNATAPERTLFDQFLAALPPSLRARCHKLPPATINGLAALLARLDLLVSNDTGPLHIALSQGRPVVALKAHDDRTFPYTLPRETPLRRSLFVRTDVVTSGPEYHASHRAMECISVEAVLAEVERVLAQLRFQPQREQPD